MIKRRKTKTVKVGSVIIGSCAPIVIQSMTKVPTTDIARCVRQINQLVRAGCGLIRIAVPRRSDTTAFAQIVQRVNVPLIADVHFSPERAIEAIEAGAAKIRLNPGNIKSHKAIHRIIDAAKMHKAAIRIGINEASIRDLKKEPIPIGKRTALMLRKMKSYVRLFENCNFTQLVLSAKSSDILRTIEINRKIAQAFDYPIHVGLTHAGLTKDAQIRSAIALGVLLAEGIGDTVRVSIAGAPIHEVKTAKEILVGLGLYKRLVPELIVCPTCARAQIDVVKLANRVEKALITVRKPIRIAVMGCVVNGPGEAADADLAICAAKNKAFLYRHGRKVSVVPESRIVSTLLKELQAL